MQSEQQPPMTRTGREQEQAANHMAAKPFHSQTATGEKAAALVDSVKHLNGTGSREDLSFCMSSV